MHSTQNTTVFKAFFNPIVPNETHSSFVNGFCFDLNSLHTHFQIFDYDDDDDSVQDPDYSPAKSSDDENISEIDSELEQAANKLLSNLMEEDIHPNIEEEHGQNSELNENIGKENKRSRHRKRNLEQSYMTQKGNFVPERRFKVLENCRKRCKEKIFEVDQKQIFNQYWALGSYKLRQTYITGLIGST